MQNNYKVCFVLYFKMKTPLPDEVFQSWLKNKPAKEIEKQFGRKITDISPMEVVGREIQKSPALLFRSKVASSNKDVKQDNIKYTYQDLSRQKFYKFSRSVPKDEWKEKDAIIKRYSDAQEVNCDRCSAVGFENCKTCEGHGILVCDYCNEAKKLLCKKCDGKGALEIDVQLYDEKGKTEKVVKKVQCGECFGNRQLVCENCANTKKMTCYTCKGSSGKACKECNGSGKLYILPNSMVPFASSNDIFFFFNSDLEKEMSKSKSMKKNTLGDMLVEKQVEPIKISDTKDLEQKKLEDLLGFWDKEASKQVRDCRKEFENQQKSKGVEPIFPVELYPLQKIDIDTSNASGYKKKKFSIYSIGSDAGYVIFDLGY